MTPLGGAFGLWPLGEIGGLSWGLWVEEEGEEDRGNTGAFQESTHPYKKAPVKPNGEFVKGSHEH